MRYRINTTFNVFGDQLIYGKNGQKVTLYKDDSIKIISRMKDMWNNDIEHWQTSCGWLLKITEDILPYFDKNEDQS
jgi:hypothetical protein